MKVLPPSETFNGLRAGDRATDGEREGTIRCVGMEPYRRMFGVDILWDGAEHPRWYDWNEAGASAIRSVAR